MWAVRTVDEGIELLMGEEAGAVQKDGSFPDGTVNARVQGRLEKMALQRKLFSSNSAGDGK